MSVSIINNIVHGPEEIGIAAHLSFGQFFYDQLKKGGDKIAQVCGETGRTCTYREILQKTVNLATSLQRLGLKKGDVVSLSSENRFEFPVASFAVIFSGGVLSTLNITYSLGELVHILNITKPKFIITSPIAAQNIYESSKDLPFVEKLITFGEYQVIPGLKYDDLVQKNVDIDTFDCVPVNGMDDTMAIMCSSGTTGLPKGVMLTHVNFLTLCEHMRYYLNYLTSHKKHDIDTFFSIIPWFHAYGFIVSMSVMAVQVKMIFLVRFQEEQFLETIQNYRVNMMTLVPPLAVFLAKHPLVNKYDLTSLTEVWCGAAPLSKEIQKAIADRTNVDTIRQGYGLTEVTMACCVDLSSGIKQGSCGTPAPGMKIKVLDIESGKILGPNQRGELWIDSPLRMKGYMGDPKSSAELIDDKGYVRTGDIGYYDNDGYFFIVDRLKELIKYKGFQVAPAEIEAILLQHPGVSECGVVGRPDEVAGELPTAFVVSQPGSDVTEAALVQFIAERVSPAKHLRGGVIFVKDIPKNQSGKILRKDLRDLLNAKSKL